MPQVHQPMKHTTSFLAAVAIILAPFGGRLSCVYADTGASKSVYAVAPFADTVGLQSRFATALCHDKSGNVWAATEDGAVKRRV